MSLKGMRSDDSIGFEYGRRRVALPKHSFDVPGKGNKFRFGICRDQKEERQTTVATAK